MDTLEIIKEKGVCCISGKPLRDCEAINSVQVNMKATWLFPVWGNLLSGESNMAVAFVHDDCVVNGKIVGEVKNVIEFDKGEVIYHPVVLEPQWDTRKQGIDTSSYSPQSLERLAKIRRDCLLLFEQSPGWKFRVRGSSIIDIITGVNNETMMVKGKKHGEFHIDACELT